MGIERPMPQFRLFQQLRFRLLRNTARRLWGGSAVRVVTVFLVSLLIWFVVYGLSALGFGLFQAKEIPQGGVIVGTVFDFLFLALTLLLLASTGIILYSSLFASGETTFLLTTPARADQVFAYKFQGAIAFSSWGFILLASPVLIAYGVGYGARWYFYALLPLYFFGFVLLPGSIGAFFCFLFVNLFPRRKKQVLLLGGSAAAIIFVLWLVSLRPASVDQAMGRDYIQRLVGQFSLAQGPLSPNHWMTRGLQAAAKGNFAHAGYYLALIWSNGLVLYLLTAWVASHWYRRGFNRVATGGMLRKRYGGHWLDRALSVLVRFLDRQTRLLVIKDFRTFRRDPAQWLQMLIFLGLMVLYFSNVKSFYQQDLSVAYMNGVSLTNLSATSILLCAYTGRFIYPMLSLEGRKFWILGLLPLKRDRLLWGKFAFSSTWALLISEFLVIFSDVMLGVPGIAVALHALTAAVVSLGLSGMSVGMGAWIPNFRETDPSKIAVGFGGTLNLIVGLLFLIVAICTMSLPYHIQAVFAKPDDPPDRYAAGIAAGVVFGVLLGAAAVWLPLRIGARSLRKMEF